MEQQFGGRATGQRSCRCLTNHIGYPAEICSDFACDRLQHTATAIPRSELVNRCYKSCEHCLVELSFCSLGRAVGLQKLCGFLYQIQRRIRCLDEQLAEKSPPRHPRLEWVEHAPMPSAPRLRPKCAREPSFRQILIGEFRCCWIDDLPRPDQGLSSTE